MQGSYPERMQFCLLKGIKKTDRRLIKKKVLWRLFPMLRYLYWLPELQWQQLELCLEFFLPIDCCHSLAIFWKEERFFPWLQCCLYFHAFCIYQTASALRKKEKVLWHMMPNTDMKQAALSSLYGIGNAGTGYQNPAPALLIVIIFLCHVYFSFFQALNTDFYFCFHSMVYSFSPVASSKPSHWIMNPSLW